jgi:hypothetical protein
MNDDDPDKHIDLGPADYWETDKGAPFWGSGAREFLIYAVLAVPAYWVAKTTVEAILSFLP